MNILKLVASSAGSAETSHSLGHLPAIESKADIFDSVKKFVRTRIEGYKARAKTRKDTEHVLQMDNDMLKDIGMTHSDRDSLEAGLTSLKELNTRSEAHFSSFY
jgi:uncharacterized protein YjiS (DUF1127 family)